MGVEFGEESRAASVTKARLLSAGALALRRRPSRSDLDFRRVEQRVARAGPRARVTFPWALTYGFSAADFFTP